MPVLLYVLLALTASLQSLLGTPQSGQNTQSTSLYNNYKIFKYSNLHLASGDDLYVPHPAEHWDLYKYSPTFAVFFGLFASLPDALGLPLWNLANALLLLLGIRYLPRFNTFQKNLILLIACIELLTSLQNSQSNALMAGLLILAFGCMERGKHFWAMAFILFSAYIKLFGVVGLALCLFYPGKIKMAGYALFWFVLFALLPFLYIDTQQYTFLMKSWQHMLAADEPASYGFSVMGWLHAWFRVDANKWVVSGIGAVLFMLPYVQVKKYAASGFRLLALCSLLIWIVIFNHKAESPTFVIAMSGVGIWFIQARKTTFNLSVFILTFLFVSLSPTDLFPAVLRREVVLPYALKGFACLVVWGIVVYEMWRYQVPDNSAEIPLTNNPHEQQMG